MTSWTTSCARKTYHIGSCSIFTTLSFIPRRWMCAGIQQRNLSGNTTSWAQWLCLAAYSSLNHDLCCTPSDPATACILTSGSQSQINESLPSSAVCLPSATLPSITPKPHWILKNNYKLIYMFHHLNDLLIVMAPWISPLLRQRTKHELLSLLGHLSYVICIPQGRYFFFFRIPPYHLPWLHLSTVTPHKHQLYPCGSLSFMTTTSPNQKISVGFCGYQDSMWFDHLNSQLLVPLFTICEMYPS